MVNDASVLRGDTPGWNDATPVNLMAPSVDSARLAPPFGLVLVLVVLVVLVVVLGAAEEEEEEEDEEPMRVVVEGVVQ